MGSFSGLYISFSGVNASKRSLESISHNISNVDNYYYTRQRAIHMDSPYNKYGNYKVGLGVDTQKVGQVRDEFLDKKMRGELSKYGFWGVRADIFSQIEEIMGEDLGKKDKKDIEDTGLSKIMDDFWKSWEEVANDPGNTNKREHLKQRAIEFVDNVNHIYNQLNDLQFSLNKNIKDVVNTVNQKSKRVAELNQQIVASEATGAKANDYRDERNKLLDELSQIMGIDYYETSSGAVNVTLGGRHLISEGRYRELSTVEDGGPFVDVCWGDSGEKLDLDDELKSGELLGLIKARGKGDSPSVGSKQYEEMIPTIKAQLDTLVSTIANAINGLHGGSDTSKHFFGSIDGKDIKAENIKLNIENVDDIIVSNSGDANDGSIAKAILDLRNGKIYGESKLNIDEFYRNLIGDLGLSGEESVTMAMAHETVINDVEGKRKSISGVSLDEEMSEMLKYQHAYVANTRVVNAIDEMIENVVNRLGVVGR